MPTPDSQSTTPKMADVFATTRWSVVLTAQQGNAQGSVQALEELCRSYWFPLYAHARRQGLNPPDAEDLVQGFFARFLEKDYLAEVNIEKGRFRSFLLGSLKHFLLNEKAKRQAQKRGGKALHVPFDHQTAESRYQQRPATPANPDQAYDRQWAITLLEQVLANLEADYTDRGKERLFAVLKDYLVTGEATGTYAEAAERLDTTEGSIKVAVHRLRQRYRQLLRAEVAQTVSNPADIDDELRNLFAVLGS